MKRFSLALLALLLVASTAAAQSLVDIAKQEEARRKAIKTPSKVYTNADLRNLAPGTPASAPQPAAGAPAATPPDSVTQAAPPTSAKDAAQESQKDEASWRARITEARSKLARAKLQSDAMQTRINSLTNDWAARDNPIERQQLAQDRANAIAELQRLKDEIDAQTKAIADIEEEARRAGVPPGWLR